MNKDKALKMIQEHIDMQQYNHAWDKCQELIEALNIANCDLKQSVQEPAYYIWRNSFDEHDSGFDIPDARFRKYFDLTPLYTQPYQWQGLVDSDFHEAHDVEFRRGAAWAEQILEERNNGT